MARKKKADLDPRAAAKEAAIAKLSYRDEDFLHQLVTKRCALTTSWLSEETQGIARNLADAGFVAMADCVEATDEGIAYDRAQHMTVEHVRARVREIDAHKYDDEAAASRERALWQDVLRTVMYCELGAAAGLAREALETLNIDFRRG